jgi:hypothetical protein
MRNLKVAVALAGAIGLGFLSNAAQAAPVSGALADAAGMLNVVEQTQYVYGGHRHCWYGNGWHGAGWYRCGYANRRGYGWGGPRGWNNWTYSGWGPVVGAPVVVVPGRYYYGGRHYSHRRWRSGRWYYY